MKVLIKGAGDLATGIAYRLYQQGCQIIMTELSEPLAVRRGVALAAAVHKGSMTVEGMTGILIDTIEDANRVLEQNKVAVIVDEQAGIRHEFCPDVLVDAVMAKRNTGTVKADAPIVIGVGPGFTAGLDCHCVVETKRGDTLGQVIWEGCALKDTGIPGEVEGYTKERLLRACRSGILKPVCTIGDSIQKGEIAAYTGGVPVVAEMSGIVRGMMDEGVTVTEGMKIGDIDARNKKELCSSISDKARCIGDGVVRAVFYYGGNCSKMRSLGTCGHKREDTGNYGIVVLAAGKGSRFGGHKLLADVEGKPMYEYMLALLAQLQEVPRVIVTAEVEIQRAAEAAGITVVENPDPERGISYSIRLGIQACMDIDGLLQGILISVCDQPGLSVDTFRRLMHTARQHPGSIVCASVKGRCQNPVVWDIRYAEELLCLTGDVGGRMILKRHKEAVICVETEAVQLADIDTRQELTGGYPYV